MKEKKIAWLVTHDAYIDRRILFFADVLMENGYSVKLFPSAYTDFTNDSDPDYVVRPLDWNVVKLYALSLDALMEEERGAHHPCDRRTGGLSPGERHLRVRTGAAGRHGKDPPGLHAANGGRAQRLFHLHPEREPRSGL